MQEAGRLHLTPDSVTHEPGVLGQVTAFIPSQASHNGGDEQTHLTADTGHSMGVARMRFLCGLVEFFRTRSAVVSILAWPERKLAPRRSLSLARGHPASRRQNQAMKLSPLDS